MSNPLNIPPSTRNELAKPAEPGQRHLQMVRIAIPLLASGLVEEAVEVQLRSMYDDDVPDDEISAVVRWAGQKVASERRQSLSPKSSRKITPPKSAPTVAPVERVEDFLAGFSCSEEGIRRISPWPPLEDWSLDSLLVLAALYYERDLINILTIHTIQEKEGMQKARPGGMGRTMTRDQWMREIRDHGTPQSRAGAWQRMNPVLADEPKNGRGFADEDVAAHRFLLLESDDLPPEVQISFLAKLRLPIAMIVSSGGKSYHAWIKVEANDQAEYRAVAKAILGRLKPFGFDNANSNPSRMSRLAGALRVIGAHGDGAQRLIYLNPDPKGETSIL